MTNKSKAKLLNKTLGVYKQALEDIDSLITGQEIWDYLIDKEIEGGFCKFLMKTYKGKPEDVSIIVMDIFNNEGVKFSMFKFICKAPFNCFMHDGKGVKVLISRHDLNFVLEQRYNIINRFINR